MTATLIVAIALALVFAFLNGVHDSSNVVATMISSRAFSPRVALGTTALANFVGPFIFGVAVADTIGNEIVSSQAISTTVIIAALLSAILWDVATWYLGFPSSSSHALIGGIIGAVWLGAGWRAIELPGMEKVLIALFTSPLIGFVAGFALLRLILALSRDASPRINGLFKRSQILTGIALALSHGTNNSQKTMGIMALALVTGGYLKVFTIPVWVILVCATMIGLGTAVGGWRLIRTLGGKIFKITAAGWLQHAANLGCGDHRRVPARRTREHHAGGQFRHTGYRSGREGQQSPLGRGAGDRDCLAADDPGFGAGGGWYLLALDTLHPLGFCRRRRRFKCS